jgi:YaiO family outer membrane protein
MTRKGFGKASIATILAVCLATPASGQNLRLGGWGSYERVTDSDDWSTIGAQLTWKTTRGHGVWGAVEIVGRFGETDVTERLGAVLHPTQRLWITAEAGTAQQPVFLPSNTWEADVAGLIAPHASLGLGYRHWNYPVGPVDMLMPHAAIESGRMSWNARVFISRNPTERTDFAVSLQAARAVSRRTTFAVLGSGGHESFFNGSTIQSLEVLSAGVGVRYNAPSGISLRIDATYTRSQPILSRGGIALGVERVF